MKDIYSLLSELQLEVRDMTVKVFEFENEMTNRNQVSKAAARLRKDAKVSIGKLNKLRDYINDVRLETKAYYDAQKRRSDNLNAAKKKRRSDNLNAAKKKEIAELEAKLAELKDSLV